MTDYGPSSMKVSLTEKLDATRIVTFETEFVVANPVEAQEKGAQFHALMVEFLSGYVTEADAL